MILANERNARKDTDVRSKAFTKDYSSINYSQTIQINAVSRLKLLFTRGCQLTLREFDSQKPLLGL
jgi:hypothetical protein